MQTKIAVPIYFNSNDVTIEAEKQKLQNYKFSEDEKVADGIGLCITEAGQFGIAFWRAKPTEQDKHAGEWTLVGYLSQKTLYDFHMCFEVMKTLEAVQADLQKHKARLDAKGQIGFAAMLDDDFRRGVTNATRLSLKINRIFRKAWFKPAEPRKIYSCPTA